MEQLSNAPVISPFEGKPETRQIIDQNGRVRFEIEARELTPWRAKIVDALATFFALVLTSVFVYAGFKYPEECWVYIFLAPFMPFLFGAMFRLGLTKSLRKQTLLVVSTNEFAVQKGQQWLKFDRRIDHRFSLLPHDKAKKETEDNEFAVRLAQSKGRVVRKKRYFGESFHLTYEYLGQRNDIAVIFGRKEALAVLTRLKACDTIMDMQANKGTPVHLRPEDEWGEQPGRIPQLT